MQQISFIGIDLAKTNFSVCMMSKDGRVLSRKSMLRSEVAEFTVQLQPCVIGIEACGGSHYWGRLFESQGHTVKMMSAHAVKAFAPAQKKNDAVDAEAIAIAARQPTISSVRVKAVPGQDMDILRNLREQYVKQRVALINQAHAVCLEYGLALPKSKTVPSLERYFNAIEDACNDLSEVARSVVLELIKEAKLLDEKALAIEKRLKSLAKSHTNYDLLTSIPGVGVLTAAAVLSHTGGKVDQFKNGRQFAAYLGLVPRQYSTGGRTSLRGITKTGNSDVRRLLILGVRTTMMRSAKKSDRINKWVTEKKTTRGFMKANVALANKTARMMYAILKTQRPYMAA